MNWFKKHADTLAIMGALLGGFLWKDSKFEKINDRFYKLEERFSSLQTDTNQIKTVLIIGGIMPESMEIKEP